MSLARHVHRSVLEIVEPLRRDVHSLREEQKKIAARLEELFHAVHGLRVGERQAAASLGLVRADHRGRYTFAAARLERGTVVLDAGCGTGYGARVLAATSPCAKVVAVDREPAAIAFAERYHASPKIEFRVADLLAPALAAESFDAVVCFETLEHVADAPALLRELHRVLRPQGWLFLSTPNQEKLPFEPLRFPFHHRHYTASELATALSDAGLVVESWHSQPERDAERVDPGVEGLYLIAVCRRGPRGAS